jgi:hypothetical protein
MTKSDYMNALKLALQDLPGDIQEELLWTYEGKFIDGMVAGKSEQESLPSYRHWRWLPSSKKQQYIFVSLKTKSASVTSHA